MDTPPVPLRDATEELSIAALAQGRGGTHGRGPLFDDGRRYGAASVKPMVYPSRPIAGRRGRIEVLAGEDERDVERAMLDQFGGATDRWRGP